MVLTFLNFKNKTMTELLITYVLLWIVGIFLGRLILPWMFRIGTIIDYQDKLIKDNWHQMGRIIEELEKLNGKE